MKDKRLKVQRSFYIDCLARIPLLAVLLACIRQGNVPPQLYYVEMVMEEGEFHLEDQQMGSVSTVTKAEVMEQDAWVCHLRFLYIITLTQSRLSLRLGLGLSLGSVIKAKPFSRREHGRIWTAKGLGSIGFTSTSGRGSNASASTVAGTKGAADSVQEMGGSNGVRQVVEWLPVRAYRINSLVNQVKVPAHYRRYHCL